MLDPPLLPYNRMNCTATVYCSNRMEDQMLDLVLSAALPTFRCRRFFLHTNKSKAICPFSPVQCKQAVWTVEYYGEILTSSKTCYLVTML